MSRFVYRCRECKSDYEVSEPFGSDPSEHLCIHSNGEAILCCRVPQKVTFLMKGTGFTRVSTNPEVGRKLSPWLGGPPKNAPDFNEVREFQYERDKLIKKGGGDSVEMRNLSIEAEKSTVSAVENKMGNNVYDRKAKEEYFDARAAVAG